MDEGMRFLAEHGYAVLFVAVLIDQFGLPLPVLPVVLAAGGLAGAGQLDPFVAVGVTALAALPGDWSWYELGRAQGMRVMRTLCRISLEPDSCVRSTQGAFARHGPRTLLVAKWVPGLQTVAPPLAGAAHLPRLPFLVYSVSGTLLWAGVLIGAGYALHEQLERVAAAAVRLGGAAVALAGLALAAWLGFKWSERRRFLRELRVARILPEELGRLLHGASPPVVVDLRHGVDFAVDPVRLPGALHIPVEEFDDRHHEIPRDRELVLYCT